MVYPNFNGNGQIMWSSTKYGSHLFTPTTPINSQANLAARLTQSTRIDVLLLGASSHRDLKLMCESLKLYIIPNETLILVDCSFALGLEAFVFQIFEQKSSVLAIFSSVDVKFQNNCHFQIGENVSMTVGLTRSTGVKRLDKLQTDCLNMKSSVGMKLRTLCEIADMAELSQFQVTSLTIKPSFCALIWKHIVNFVCCHVLHAIYDDMLFDSKGPVLAPVLKGVYQELCKIGLKLGVEKINVDLSALVANYKSKYTVRDDPLNASFTEFNFQNGRETFVRIALLQLLILSDDIQCGTVVALECTLATFERVLQLEKKRSSQKEIQFTKSMLKPARARSKPASSAPSLNDRVTSLLGPNKYRC
ncbi:unnamed protein product [Kuraishia capsulata CBS 1993]|uniref:Ketopantoate reductase C-terminal domain-containing protein n=1 Tax=Kuraishia capsulata CBS 1993 TaxID=1382522 RepID=W6MQQ7_9ASCO|nr:uncharacterized protein KUCA_T00004667001 [Kuraishia capsulata CBS 1993]CDK28683.1 unnamed protein product [Kuraishia capsulata CBS 1993]